MCVRVQDDDEDDEYGAPKRKHGKRSGAQGGLGDGGEHHQNPPASYTKEHAAACVQAMRQMYKSWQSLLCKVGMMELRCLHHSHVCVCVNLTLVHCVRKQCAGFQEVAAAAVVQGEGLFQCTQRGQSRENRGVIR